MSQILCSPIYHSRGGRGGLTGEAAAYQMKKYASHRRVTEAFLMRGAASEDIPRIETAAVAVSTSDKITDGNPF